MTLSISATASEAPPPVCSDSERGRRADSSYVSRKATARVDADTRDADNARLCVEYQRGQEARRRLRAGQWDSEHARRALQAACDAGQRAASVLVHSNYGLIVKLVHLARSELVAGKVPTDDLIQLGVLGFLRGVERFDPARGTKLGTWTQHWIREAVRNAFRDSGGLSGVHGADLAIGLRHYVALVEETTGRVDHDVVADLWNQAAVARYSSIMSHKPEFEGMDQQRLEEEAELLVRKRGLWLTGVGVANAIRRMQVITSLDATVDSEDDATLAEQVTDGWTVEAHESEQAEQEERVEAVEQALAAALTVEEYEVIQMYFGLNRTDGPLTVDQIAEHIQMSPGRVNALLESALFALRNSRDLQRLVGIGD